MTVASYCFVNTCSILTEKCAKTFQSGYTTHIDSLLGEFSIWKEVMSERWIGSESTLNVHIFLDKSPFPSFVIRC